MELEWCIVFVVGLILSMLSNLTECIIEFKLFALRQIKRNNRILSWQCGERSITAIITEVQGTANVF